MLAVWGCWVFETDLAQRAVKAQEGTCEKRGAIRRKSNGGDRGAHAPIVYSPRRFLALSGHRRQYCKNCEGAEETDPAVKIAPVPLEFVPKSIVSFGVRDCINQSPFLIFSITRWTWLSGSGSS